MNRYIGIDGSLSSTAVCILTDDPLDVKFYCFHNSKASKWHRAMEPVLTEYEVSYTKYPKDYSQSELLKMYDYDKVTDKIMSTIKLSDKNDYVSMEGYAMRSSGNVADLFAFGTLLRYKILNINKKLLILSPMTIKTGFASLVYEKDKGGVYRNAVGLAAGKFTKKEMFQCLMDLRRGDKFYKTMQPYESDLLPLKNIPSPINDCVDAYAAACILRQKVTDGTF